MKKVFVLFTVVMLMAVMAWEKQSGKPVESEFLLDNAVSYTHLTLPTTPYV